jgi:Ca-activated chloride channel family protein
VVRGLAAWAVGLGALASGAWAQAPGPTPVFPVAADVVHVTASVHDREGNLVRGLGAEDFTVLEDGRRQRVVVFGRATEPGHEEAFALDLGLLMDTSESMLKEMRLSQEAAIRFLETVPRARELLVIFFDQDLRISRYDNEHQQGLFERILETKGRGTTALYDAIAVYLSRVQDSSGRKVLLLFTDGEDSTSAVSLREVLQLVRGSPVTIYVVAFTGTYGIGSNRFLAARGFLNELARITGGQVFAPQASKELARVYDAILDQLTNQYLLGYVSDNQARDGKFRKLKVEAKDGRLRVRHRAGYYAPRQ